MDSSALRLFCYLGIDFNKNLEVIFVNESNFSKQIEGSFSWIYNDILYDSELSLRAKGLWAYMNGKPDGWHFSSAGICSQTKEGRDAILSALRELCNAHLLTAEKQADGHVSYCLFGKKSKKPNTENPTVGFSHCGKAQPYSKKELIVKKNNSKTKEINKESSEVDSILSNFERLFGYPAKGSCRERAAISDLLYSKGQDWLLKIMIVWYQSRNDQFSPRISDFCQFRQKYPALLEWAQRKHGQMANQANNKFDLNRL